LALTGLRGQKIIKSTTNHLHKISGGNYVSTALKRSQWKQETKNSKFLILFVEYIEIQIIVTHK